MVVGHNQQVAFDNRGGAAPVVLLIKSKVFFPHFFPIMIEGEHPPSVTADPGDVDPFGIADRSGGGETIE